MPVWIKCIFCFWIRSEVEGWMRSWQPDRTIAFFEWLIVGSADDQLPGCTWLTGHVLHELTRCFINLFYLFFIQAPKMAWSIYFTTQSHWTAVLYSPHVQTQIPNSSDVKYFDLFHTECRFRRIVHLAESGKKIRSGGKKKKKSKCNLHFSGPCRNFKLSFQTN